MQADQLAYDHSDEAVLILSKFSFLLPVVLCVLSSLPCAGQSASAAASTAIPFLPDAKAQLIQIGTRTYPDGSHTPLWAVMLGNTAQAEQIAQRYSRFGPYGLNATLWTRAEADTPTGWVRTAYRRPQNVDEAMDWYENSAPFTSRQQGDCSLLPAAFAGLDTDVIKNLDFVIQYDDGSIKAYLSAGTSRIDAEYALASLGGELEATSAQ